MTKAAAENPGHIANCPEGERIADLEASDREVDALRADFHDRVQYYFAGFGMVLGGGVLAKAEVLIHQRSNGELEAAEKSKAQLLSHLKTLETSYNRIPLGSLNDHPEGEISDHPEFEFFQCLFAEITKLGIEVEKILAGVGDLDKLNDICCNIVDLGNSFRRRIQKIHERLYLLEGQTQWEPYSLHNVINQTTETFERTRFE